MKRSFGCSGVAKWWQTENNGKEAVNGVDVEEDYDEDGDGGDNGEGGGDGGDFCLDIRFSFKC